MFVFFYSNFEFFAFECILRSLFFFFFNFTLWGLLTPFRKKQYLNSSQIGFYSVDNYHVIKKMTHSVDLKLNDLCLYCFHNRLRSLTKRKNWAFFIILNSHSCEYLCVFFFKKNILQVIKSYLRMEIVIIVDVV